MSDQVFKNLGKFMSYEEKVISSGKPSKIIIKYTQPNYSDPKKVWEHGEFEDKISEELLEKIADLSSGEEICVHTCKNDKGYGVLVNITEAKDAPQKYGNGKTAYKNGGYAPKDETGIAVGAAWTNAIQLWGTIPESDTSVTDEYLQQVSDVAWKILMHKVAQETKLRAYKLAKGEVTAKKEEEKPLSKIEQMKAKKAAETKSKKKSKPVEEVNEDPSIEQDDLDEIKFDDEE